MKIIIIGAGPAGLTAAYEILGRTDEHTVEIYESSDRIGGISQTVRYKNCRMDLGGHRFFSKIDRVNEMWDEILPVQGEPSRYDRLLGCTHTLTKGGGEPYLHSMLSRRNSADKPRGYRRIYRQDIYGSQTPPSLYHSRAHKRKRFPLKNDFSRISRTHNNKAIPHRDYVRYCLYIREKSSHK